ncbi:hypothetical protein HanPSC8_Chr09g0399811 [Helianthus annuus]|nr:hypothetical protein HanPSC8_Chr09g0399811 [Helianthus annuus]
MFYYNLSPLKSVSKTFGGLRPHSIPPKSHHSLPQTLGCLMPHTTPHYARPPHLRRCIISPNNLFNVVGPPGRVFCSGVGFVSVTCFVILITHKYTINK